MNYNNFRKKKLHRASKVMATHDTDSVARAKSLGKKRAFDVLWEAQQYWQAMESFRLDRERNKNYTYGKQWNDIICVDGKKMREEDYIRSQGNVALKNNLIRRMVQAVLGVYRSQAKEPTIGTKLFDDYLYCFLGTIIIKYCKFMNTDRWCDLHLMNISC